MGLRAGGSPALRLCVSLASWPCERPRLPPAPTMRAQTAADMQSSAAVKPTCNHTRCMNSAVRRGEGARCGSAARVALKPTEPKARVDEREENMSAATAVERVHSSV